MSRQRSNRSFLHEFTRHNSKTVFGTTRAHYIIKALEKYPYYKTAI